MTGEAVISRPTTDRTTVTTWIARVLLAVAGLVSLFGAIYFTFFATVEQGGVANGADWAVAIWSMVMSVAYLVAAITVRADRPRLFWFTVGLVVLHLIFGLVKLIGYREFEAVPFFVADIAILVLLVVSRRSGRP